MKNIISSLVLVLIVSCLLFGQGKEIAFTEYDLPNGLHVILHKDNSTPIVAVTTTYHVGSKNEDPMRTGFAHFFEHLMFEGSENIGRGQIDELIQNAGGQLNASTSFDKTTYFFVLPSNQLELGLWIESERMLHSKVDSVGVETQRKVVKEERRQSYDNRPYGSIIEKTFQHAFKVHPYRWTPIGSFQYIDQATIDEFRDFYKTFYVPDNAVLSIAGDIDINKTKELIASYYNAIPKGTKAIPRPTEIEPRQAAEVRDTVYDNIRLPAVIQAYHIPKMGDKDFYALSMLTTLLSSGQSSRLYKELVDNKKLAVSTGSFPFPLEDPGLFLVYAISGFGKTADENEATINAEIAKAQTDLLSDEELQKIKSQVETDFVMDKGQMRGIATSLAEYYLIYKNTNLINKEISRYLAVTKEDIRRVAKQYLQPANRVVLYYLPKPASK
ncbi:MAG: insulinase family protein [Ignavibacteriales bacterium]|nr:insulinase family protein [Ignavibacteriales bacterium]